MSVFLSVLFSSCLLVPSVAQEGVDGTEPDALAPAGWLTVPSVDDRGRRPFRPDAVFARHLLDPDSSAPVEGGTLIGERGVEVSWEYQETGEGGKVSGDVAWAYASVEVTEPRVMMARLQRASTLFVNGDGFAGDVYRYGWQGVPVSLRAGRNDIYVTGIRGGFSFELHSPAADLMIDSYDRTAPHLVIGAADVGPLGLLLVNATDRDLSPVVKMAEGDLFAGVEVQVGALRPLEVTKVSLPQPFIAGARVAAEVEEVVRVVQAGASGVEPARARVPMGVVEDGPARRETYLSAIDGSAQYYALLSPSETDGEESGTEASIVLSLHGAGVGALAQARSYSRRPGFWVAAPTNRRPFGFDWQDWGRMDAYEVRDLVLARAGVDARRVHVTGHSMGGHGAWHLAANDTDGFAAVAPSAGWCSFDTYGGRPAGTLSELWHAADAPSRTLDFVDGLVQVPTFVLHGTGDNNVPPTEADAMIAALIEAGGDPRVHMQEGAGHWWDSDKAPGADCVDWPGIFELFRDHPSVEAADELDWISAGPGVDSRHHELIVEQVLEPGRPFRVSARLDGSQDPPVFRVLTENVRLMAVEASERLIGATLEVDGQLQPKGFMVAGRPAWVKQHAQDAWLPSDAPASREKRADRMGPFKKAFDRGFLFVVGTAGTEEETAELLARARYDAQVWWYRGNGRAPLVTDEEFVVGERAPGNVILYGNATSNAAWHALIEADCPLQAIRGQLTLGDRTWEGDDLGAVFVAPRPDDPAGLVGVFADTGSRGTRLGYTLAPFVSGVGYPDYAVFDMRVLSEGDGGVLAAGWWDNLWELSSEPAAGGGR